MKPLHRRVKPMKPVESKEKKETLYFFSWKCTGFIGFTRLCSGFMPVSLRFHAVSCACGRNWSGGLRQGGAAPAVRFRDGFNTVSCGFVRLLVLGETHVIHSFRSSSL